MGWSEIYRTHLMWIKNNIQSWVSNFVFGAGCVLHQFQYIDSPMYYMSVIRSQHFFFECFKSGARTVVVGLLLVSSRHTSVCAKLKLVWGRVCEAKSTTKKYIEDFMKPWYLESYSKEGLWNHAPRTVVRRRFYGTMRLVVISLYISFDVTAELWFSFYNIIHWN